MERPLVIVGEKVHTEKTLATYAFLKVHRIKQHVVFTEPGTSKHKYSFSVTKVIMKQPRHLQL